MAERISRKRATEEGWLSARAVRDATGLGHATLQERFENAARDGIRVARLESGEVAPPQGRPSRGSRTARGARRERSSVEALASEIETLRAELVALRSKLRALDPASFSWAPF